MHLNIDTYDLPRVRDKCGYLIPGFIYLNTNVVFDVRQAPLAIRTSLCCQSLSRIAFEAGHSMQLHVLVGIRPVSSHLTKVND